MTRIFQNDRSAFRRIAATFFVLALVAFATAQLIHAHNPANPTSTQSESHCLLCVAAHSSAAPVQATIAPVTSQYFILHIASEPQLYSRLTLPASFIRPPPENL